MKSTAGTETAKRAAGRRAAETVPDGARVGLGTGSTAAAAIRALADRDALDVTCVATSHASRALAREVGLPLTDLSATATVDVAIDGADQTTPEGALVKGGGAAHAREKLVAHAADRFLVVVDDTKLADRLTHPVPVECLPDAESAVRRALRAAGGEPTLRSADRKDGPVVTDNGNLVFDCDFGRIDDPAALAADLNRLAGVVEHGLFPHATDALVVGRDDDTATLREL
ncbi:MAG: ribose-5-phosphate isomerase RpiA [Halobaculum sp.]